MNRLQLTYPLLKTSGLVNLTRSFRLHDRHFENTPYETISPWRSILGDRPATQSRLLHLRLTRTLDNDATRAKSGLHVCFSAYKVFVRTR